MTRLVALALAALVLAACAPAATPTPTVRPTTAAETQPEAAAATADPAASAARPAWQTLPLVDARSGESFTLADFAGQTVFVEPMATWCTNCRTQLGNVRAAREQLGDTEVVFIGLSVETDLTVDALRQYTEDQGFEWTFAVATPELLGALVDTFGRTVANPPSTPHFIIRPDGTTTDLVTGIEAPEQIIARLTEA